MIITCPNCTSKFAVKAEAIGATGRKVRCAKCKHDWFQNPEPGALAAAAAIAEEPVATEPLPPGANLPTNQGHFATPLYMKLAFAGCVMLFIFTLSITASNKILPHLGWYYSMLGIHDDSGIALYNISAEKTGDGAKKELLVKGRIVNDSEADRAIPNLRITLLDAKRKEVRTVMLDSHEAALAPGDGVDFENRIPAVAATVVTVVMDIGNGLNLAAR